MKNLKSLLVFFLPYRWWVLLAVFCMILVTSMNMAGPWIIRILIQTITHGVEGDSKVSGQINLLALTVLIIYLIRGVSSFGTNYISHYAAWKILEDIQQYLYDHLQNLSLRYFSNRQTGELMSRIINDTRNFEILLAHAIPTIVVNGIMLLGITAILLSMDLTLALYTLIPVPLLIWMVIKFSKISRPLFRKAQEEIAHVNSILQDNFTGIKEIKAFNKEEYESGRTRRRIRAYTGAILRALKLSNGFHPTIEFVSGTGTIIVMFFGGHMALSNTLPIEDLVAFLLYLAMFYQPITAFGQINEGLQQALASADRVMEILQEKPEVEERPDSIEMKKIEGHLEFSHVSFSYIEKIPVLKDISFKIGPGETLALVGATGVGKTTIASLIPRFYDPTEGEILLDSIDIRRITLNSLRRQISIVSQDVFLFHGTVKENILYGSLCASYDEMIEASKAANAHDFIVDLEDGYNTVVGERGVKLSGGQKQRISIARAILKKAPILILDEATSAVDTETERLIQESLDRLKKDKTSIIIAHRLSTITKAQLIVVLKDGEIIEQGHHDELLKKNGVYRRLCSTQVIA